MKDRLWPAILVACALGAATTSERLRPLNDVATALTGRNPTAALEPFDKTLPEFNQLSSRFTALTAGYDLENEIDVQDEQDTPSSTDVTLRWTLTLTSPESNDQERRTAEIHVRLALRDNKWKIVAFSPIDIFDPQPRPHKR